MSALTSTRALSSLGAIAVCALAACSSPGGGQPVGDTAVGDVPELSTVDSGAAADTGLDATDTTPTDDVSPDAVTDTAIPANCGDGTLDPGEMCDDGNRFPGDGCSAACDSDERCGNGFRDAWEECDDGNLFPGDGCNGACGIEAGCGNGVIDRGEQCDDGNLERADGCSPTCQLETAETLDTDGDTIIDADEGSGAVDTDGDGTPDSEDLDSDGDGVLDVFEAGDDDYTTHPVDTDLDGTPDFRDTDADGDGIPDSYEGSADSDGDGLSDFQDVDSDGDYVPDALETTADSDGDGIPDYLDTDSDNDTILDAHELFADSDGDGVPNRVDLDSDGDLLSDADEAGDSDPATYPADVDGDGQPNYIDYDSDGDGLHDDFEPGCPGGPRHDTPDSDGDGYDDLAELLVGSDPCTPTTAEAFHEYTDFFFVLPEGDPAQEAPLNFSSDIVKADVHFNLDSSGSMDGEIGNLRSGLSGFIVPNLSAQIDDVAFGLSDYRDCNYGFRLRQRITTNTSSVQTALNNFGGTSGGNEPMFTSLWHVGSGSAASGCGISAFNPGSGFVAGVADGTIGGPGFRSGAFPVVVHVTDESSEDNDCGGCRESSSSAIASLRAQNIRAIGVISGSAPRSQLETIATATGGVVPVCAWDGARPSGCGASQCCTGMNGAGRAPSGGVCPLVFDINTSGSGLRESAVTAIVALVNTTTLDVTTELRRDEDEFARTGIDTSCFITSIVPSHAVGPGSCSTTPTPADINPPDGVMDAFLNVTPGTELYFDVTAQNDVCVPATDEPQAFNAYIDVIGDGFTVLDTQLVTIIVPATVVNPSTVP